MKPFETLREVRSRVAEAVVAQSGVANEALRQHLREMLGGTDAAAGALLRSPVLEGAHPFVTAAETIGSLSGSLLDSDFVAALDGISNENEYRFPATRKPFKHQLEAWRHLLSAGKPQSVLVTSGTGSGKTECFLFPILSDLARQASTERAPLEGVQAIMLYPLNALIESQRERLSAWAAPFKGKVRYCLYNGDLPRKERPESERRRSPEEVVDRPQLRASPPPVLVTNVTMLEYMLARAEDQPIIDRSKGKLRWIVLDEAHSLVGAAAAEIALLLRRILLAFNVRAEDVHFVATSATIGSGEGVREELKRFLADVAGVPDENVHVVEGARSLPRRPTGSAGGLPADLSAANPAELYQALGSDAETWRLVERLFKEGVPFADFEHAARRNGIDTEEFIYALARAARVTESGDEERLAPIRIHAFERAVPGMWSCINPTCAGKPSDWPFGKVVGERSEHCLECGAPVLEILACFECGETFLEGVQKGSSLSAPLRHAPRDEFSFDGSNTDEREEESEDDEAESGSKGEREQLQYDRLFGCTPTATARGFWVDRVDWSISDAPTDSTMSLLREEHRGCKSCPHCSPERQVDPEILRPLRFGAPFLIGTAAPILLEGTDKVKHSDGEVLPSEGRRLLSFTDSRQGTARFAAKIQMEAERNFVRSFVYHSVQDSMRQTGGGDSEAAAKLQTEIAELEKVLRLSPSPVIEEIVASRKNDLARLTQPNTDGIEWPTMVDRLASRIEVGEWMKQVWQGRDDQLFSDTRKLAEFLLLREFARRPKRANSVETLGLARLRIPSIDALTDAQLPGPFRRRQKTLADWRAYLIGVLTYFVRANGAIAVSYQTQHWVMPKARLRSLVGPDEQTHKDRSLIGWPNGYFRSSSRSRPVAFLVSGLGLNLDDDGDRADLDDCLRAAWHQLQSTMSPDPDRRIFDFSKTFVAPIVDGFVCPVTRRVLDQAPFGLTPYGLEEARAERRKARATVLPVLPVSILGQVDKSAARAVIRPWMETDAAISDLRRRSAWTDISDRIALFAEYARSAEHSAQQDSRRLRRYERQFKSGAINILNCSTTMEMGVDIGSVSSIMMTNVPPSIASYRQRVGRAGRRGQATALAFTFCKDRPLDRVAFRDPASFLKTEVAAPKVTLSSRPIVQRHVNAYLLGCFVRERSGDALKMQIGTFLGCPGNAVDARPLKHARPVEAFIEWLRRPGTRGQHEANIAALTKRSILEGHRGLIDETLEAVGEVSAKFVREWEGLRLLASEEGTKEAGKSRMAMELKRLCEDFLLSGLADRGFLPGHGFPTDVVSFIPGKEAKVEADQTDGNRQFRAVGPQRSLDLAIRDYAPGSEVVLDGLVYMSSGVTLNWKRPASEENIAEIQSLRFHWRCQDCKTNGTSRRPPDHCLGCGSSTLRTEEFLRPAGFSVDPRDKPHAETDIVSYVPPEDPAVSTGDSPWQPLPLPELGRFRCSREGQVYYSNRGPGHLGYALCLHCGRAEPEAVVPGRSAVLTARIDHRPLRYRKGQDFCAGNANPFSIRRSLVLGHEITTDVFELQPQHPLKRAGANALAIALREALAQELGVEADEMGFAVEQTRGALGGPAVSLFLFDRASGGAGFSVSLEHNIRSVLKRAERVLDCRTPGCLTACAACVLTSDAPDGPDALDRSAALDYMRAHLSFPDQLSTEDKFAPDAELSLALVDEIDRSLRSSAGSRLTVVVPAATAATSFENWPLADQFLDWRTRGHRCRLAIPREMLATLTSADKLALRDFALRHAVDLVELSLTDMANGAHGFAFVDSPAAGATIWASRDPDAAIVGRLWGRATNNPVAFGSAELSTTESPIELDSLKQPPGAQVALIDGELDGDMATFGERMADKLVGLLKNASWEPSQVASILYQDPYVCSPLVARLVVDTLARLLTRLGNPYAGVTIETRGPRTDERPGSPWQILHDWRDAAVQESVIETLGKQVGTSVRLVQKPVPHGRFMTLSFTDGQQATIVLDQGFGAWSTPRHIPVRHDFGADGATQAAKLRQANVMLAKTGAGRTYLVAYVGK